MTEPRDELSGALHRLRDQIRGRVSGPPAAALRARATYRLRVRRIATAGVAAAAVVAVAVGGNALLQPTAGPPTPPIDSPTRSVAPTAPPVTPSPRPEPREVTPVDDPIAEVAWGSATITFPPEEGCPDGAIDFTPVSDIFPNGIGPADGYPALALNATGVAYGDLTGDGRPEAVLTASCVISEEGLTSGHGGRLLVVTRRDGGQLVALGRVGPPGASFLSWWVADGQLLIDADPWTVNAEDHFVPVPGLALAYRWDGAGFGDWQPAADYPPVLPLAPGEDGPPVRPGAAVAGTLGCPDAELRFTRADGDWGGSATTGQASYTIPAGIQQPYLFDLDRTGQRLLVVALSCTRTGGGTGHGLAVFEPAGAGWRGISALLLPARHELGGWRMDGDLLAVEWIGPDGGVQPPKTYRWTGTVLEPAGE